MKAKKYMSQETLKENLRYDPETGLFWWRYPRRGRRLERPAGSLTPKGYVMIKFEGEKYSAHRLAWLYVYGVLPDGFMDHINHLPNDNRIENLRVVSPAENTKNTSLYRNNKTGILGVGLHGSGKYQSYIRHGGRMKHLGLTDDFFEACCLRKSAERKYGFHENHGRSK